MPTTLPVVPIPLNLPDKDIPLDLQAVLTEIYDEAAYDLTLDYSQTPPPPALASEDANWIGSIMS